LKAFKFHFSRLVNTPEKQRIFHFLYVYHCRPSAGTDWIDYCLYSQMDHLQFLKLPNILDFPLFDIDETLYIFGSGRLATGVHIFLFNEATVGLQLDQKIEANCHAIIATRYIEEWELKWRSGLNWCFSKLMLIQ
jgi:hypothetical protein